MMDWFDSPLYHTLYGYRDEAEAAAFIDLLVAKMGLQTGRFVDVACGKGRHAQHLAQVLPSAQVVGLDLAANSILAASAANTLPNCSYFVHDMRQPLSEKFANFDVVFNLFTSFGYFDSDAQHQEVMGNWAAALQPKGRLVIDFINAQKAILNLVGISEKNIGDQHFRMQRRVENGYIIKDIRVYPLQPMSERPNTFQHFQERVRAFGLADFERMATAVGLRLTAVFGDYNLSDFAAEDSPRLIMIFEK
jgi:SAM-dependent methyltransferase